MKPWNYLLLLFLPAMVVGGNLLGGWWNFLVLACVFAAYPAANIFLSSSEAHAHDHDRHASSASSFVALLFVPVLITITGWCVYTVSKTKIDAVSYCGFAISLGIINGVLGFTLAHEFIHRSSPVCRAAGYLLLLQNNYMHYGIEHVRGHHVYACTPEDPHTARVGESVYVFLPRAIAGTYKNAWKIERKRLRHPKHETHFKRNRMLLFALAQLAVMCATLFISGVAGLIFFLLQNAVAIFLLHTINYLQHYGLLRQKTHNGNYERLDAHHAWNTGRSNSSLNLFHLENHADHHMHPGLPFDALTHTHDSPEHPAGYSFMVLLSLIPPLWFKIMNKRIPSNFLNTPL